MIDVETLILTQTKIERQQHLNLSTPCIIRGGNSTIHIGVLAQYLNTTIPMNNNYSVLKILLCHACNNGKCSNPLHLYWETYEENYKDSKLAGVSRVRKTPFTYKHSEEVRKKISESKKGKPGPNPTGKGLIPGSNRGMRYKQKVKLMWITNGTVNTKIQINDVIPENFYRGKVQKINEHV